MKKYLKLVLIPLISLLLASFIFSIFNLFEISVHPIFYLLSMIIISLLFGLEIGIISKNKAYLKGILASIIYILVLFIISICITRELTLFTILYYLIIILSITIASMIGINKKN